MAEGKGGREEVGGDTGTEQRRCTDYITSADEAAGGKRRQKRELEKREVCNDCEGGNEGRDGQDGEKVKYRNYTIMRKKLVSIFSEDPSAKCKNEGHFLGPR